MSLIIYWLLFYLPKFKSNNFVDFIPNFKRAEKIYDSNNEIKSLKEQLEAYKKDNLRLKSENEKLKSDLLKANNLINKQNNNSKNNEIKKLKEENYNLKLQIQNIQPKYNLDDIMVINFISTDFEINNCGIKCLKTNTFAEVEEKLYQKFDSFRNTNNIFLFKGRQILRFKTIYENGIKEGEIIQLVTQEE